jgi:acyl-CoA thioesterase FadM
MCKKNKKPADINKMSIVELKALMFDLEQELRQTDEKYRATGQVLQHHLDEQDKKKGKEE